VIAKENGGIDGGVMVAAVVVMDTTESEKIVKRNFLLSEIII